MVGIKFIDNKLFRNRCEVVLVWGVSECEIIEWKWIFLEILDCLVYCVISWLCYIYGIVD